MESADPPPGPAPSAPSSSSSTLPPTSSVADAPSPSPSPSPDEMYTLLMKGTPQDVDALLKNMCATFGDRGKTWVSEDKGGTVAAALCHRLSTHRNATEEHVELLLQALLIIARGSQAKERIRQMKGIHLLGDVMEYRTHTPCIQARACGVLANLSMLESVRADLIDQGVLDKVLQALEAHRSNAGVQHAACMVFVNMAAGGDTQVENRQAMFAEKGVPLLIAALNAHLEDTQVQGAACLALGNLSVDDALKRNIGAFKGIEAVLRAMRAHTDVTVLRSGLHALGNLARDEENRKTIVRCGGLELVLRIVREHTDNRELVERGTTILRALRGEAFLPHWAEGLVNDLREETHQVLRQAREDLVKLAASTQVKSHVDATISLEAFQNVVDKTITQVETVERAMLGAVLRSGEYVGRELVEYDAQHQDQPTYQQQLGQGECLVM